MRAALVASRGDRRRTGGDAVTPSERNELEAELVQLEADNAAATEWGAAVGARCERIRAIQRRLSADHHASKERRT